MSKIEKLKTRDEIEEKYKWNMQDVYQSIQDFEDDIAKAKEMFPILQAMEGHICDDAESLYRCMNTMTQIEYRTEKVYFYANQLYHENLGDTKNQALAAKSVELINEFYTVSSFVQPELLLADENQLLSWIQKTEKLHEFEQYFRDLLRQKSHILSKDMEELLARTQVLSQASGEIFQVFNNADLKFPVIKDEEGKEVELTHARFSLFLESDNRSVRKNAFMGLYDTYRKYKNTLASVYNASVKKDCFYSSVRKFHSSRQMYLDDANIPECVYDQLVETVDAHLPLLHRYVELRKKVLKVDEVHLYDIYAPLTKDTGREISYDEAKNMVLKGLAPMGEEYLNLLKEGFNNRWIDVYENEGKKSGAYSWSIYGVHPYVLLNYQPNLNSVFTIAHEMGHALHSYYSNQNQTYTNAEYKIFVAEVASTCNESLLIQHLIKNSTNKNEKAYLINHFLEQFRTTLFRQTMFAEFEKICHDIVDQGGSLTCDVLCEKYYELNQKYFGDNIVIDKEIEMEWARIPHFYSAFYVYQYATGFSAAIALSKLILKEGEIAVEKYKKFLKGGSSDYPIELLKIAGVDMSSKEPIEAAMKVFEELLNEFETLV